MRKREKRPEGYVERGQVIRLDPTYRQANAMARAAGCARFSFNWGLDEWGRQYRAGGKPNANKLKRQFNTVKDKLFPWIYESPKDANQEAFNDLGASFKNWFDWMKGKRKGRKVGYPRFKKRGKHDAFYLSNDKFSVHERGERGLVRMSVIGTVRMQERLNLEGKNLSARVFRKADHWYISIQVELDARVSHVHEHAIVGIDLGVKTAMVPSHGDPVDSPKPLKKALKQLRRASRRLSRRPTPGGKNRRKAKILLAKCHERVANIRNNFLHQITTKIVRENQTVVIEDLAVQGMMRNHKLARAISDVGMSMFRRFVTYKFADYGGHVIVADRWFPSSKRCSGCGHVKDELPLSMRTYVCDKCGLVIDRDRNAALNLEQYPRLAGNLTPTDTGTSTSGLAPEASAVVEVGTIPCPPLDTL